METHTNGVLLRLGNAAIVETIPPTIILVLGIGRV